MQYLLLILSWGQPVLSRNALAICSCGILVLLRAYFMARNRMCQGNEPNSTKNNFNGSCENTGCLFLHFCSLGHLNFVIRRYMYLDGRPRLKCHRLF